LLVSIYKQPNKKGGISGEILTNSVEIYGGETHNLVTNFRNKLNLKLRYHFTTRILKKGNSNTKRLAYLSLVRPLLEYGVACWDPYREGQISALDRVQKKAAKFAHHTNSSNWETLASRRKLSRICSLFKAYSGEWAWKVIGDKLQRPHYLSRIDHERKIRSRRQRTDKGKYAFVNRTIQDWN